MAKSPARFGDSGRLLFWDTLAQDVRFACRLFVRSPLLTAAQAASPFMQLVIRTDGDPLPVIPAVRQAVAALDPEQPVVGFNTMEQMLIGSAAQRRFQTALLTVFGAMALLLAAIGVYAAMSHMVRRRTREIGVRLALGARPSEVFMLILRNGLMVTVVGAAAGLAGAAMISQLLGGACFTACRRSTSQPTRVSRRFCSSSPTWRPMFPAGRPGRSIRS